VSEFIAERMWPEAPIERSIFGTADPERIWAQVLEACPEAVDCFAFEVSVGALFGLRLRDGSRVALKIHRDRDTGSLEAVQRVQAHLVERGFPCPRPLGVRGAATLEEWADEGIYRDAHDPAVRRVLARYLARLFALTRPLQPLTGLEPFFPPSDGPLWPVPHNVLFDFEATAAGAEWIDEIGREAKPLRDAGAGELVIGHGDWTVKHFRFAGLRPTIVYDWDSLNTDYETIFVGLAADSFTYTEHLPVEVWPTLSETRAFLADYEQERERPFTAEELRAVGAAVVYSRAYGARCTHAVEKDARAMQLEEFADAFLPHA
jgi:Phosphotransferase enzyme family